MTRVTVIIPTYNRAGFINRAVDSVLNQSFQDFELIVVDDGSTDETQNLMEAYGDAITCIRRPHAGVSASRNTGIENSRGSLIALLDSDDWWLPEKLEVQVNFFDNNKNALICQTEEIWIRNGRRVNPAAKHKKPDGDVFIPSLRLCLVSPSAVMMRKELFDRVGLFDENLPACEDYDLWLRVAARFPVHLIDLPLIMKTGGHDDQLSRTTMGLDQYRVTALVKIIKSGMLSREQEQDARKELAYKATIYGQGCLKRGKENEGRKHLALAEKYGPEK